MAVLTVGSPLGAQTSTLTRQDEPKQSPRVIRSGSLNSSTQLLTLVVLALTLSVAAAVPFNQATVTRLQNKVSYGDVREGLSKTRPAAPRDVIRAMNFLLTETEARAELQYEDGSIVRVGQNTVFTFEADTRTLSLTKGTFIFYVPKGAGGGMIKTPSLSAAITGTVGKVSVNTIAILEGSVKLIPSGRPVKAGQFARRNADGSITIDFFAPDTATDGKLMSFNGPMPGFAEERLAPALRPSMIDTRQFDLFERGQNLPSSIGHFFPQIEPPDRGPVDRSKQQVFVPPPQNRPPTVRPPRHQTPY